MTLFEASVNPQRVEWQLGQRGLRLPASIVKRDGTLASFDLTRIARALAACYDALPEEPATPVGQVVQGVAVAVAARYQHATPTVEQVQELVEVTLFANDEVAAALAYIDYRDARSRDRGERIPADVREAFADSSEYFPTALREFQYYDKYSRWSWELGRRETWLETVDRVVGYLRWLVREHGSHLPEEVFERVHAAILRMEVMPSMRALSQAGPSAQRNALAIYNCSYAPLVDAKSFGEIMRVSMAGCGVGWSVERDYVEQFPRIKRQSGKVRRLMVEDSADGWAMSTEEGIESLFAGWAVEWDYSLVRPAGAPLLTKGGRASGPGPLQRVHQFARERILSRQGSYLTTLDAHDIACVTAGAAVSGGVRRTAAIALFDWDDQLMRHCKTGATLDANPHRWNANNSAVWPEGLSQAEVASAMLEMVASNRGEPGIFSRANALRTKPSRRAEARLGTNPCLTGDAVIATVDGPRTFESLAADGKDVLVYAWHPETKTPVIRMMRRPHKTRENTQVLEVEFDSGLKVRCTPDHSFYSFRGKKVQAKDLTVGKSVRAWSMSEHRDGHLRVHGWDASANKANHQYVARMVYECFYGQVPEGMIVHHKNEDKLDNHVSNLEAITPVEHNQEHYPARFAAGFDGTARNHKVVAVREAGTADVYNGCVDDAHTYIVLDPEPVAGISSGIVSANCGEINLRPWGLCNLSIAVARADDTPVDLYTKVELATVIGTIQSLATNFPGMRPEWRRNAIEERLLGVDITGQADNWMLSEVSEEGAKLRDGLREHAVAVNARYARMLGINPAASITCNKPSGNSSQLLDTSSGIHRRYAPYYIRRTRVSATTPLYRVLRDAGMDLRPENGQTAATADTWVASWPVRSPEGVPTAKDFSAVEQCEFWLLNKLHWTEHNPSVTINYRPDEVLDLINWVWEHRDVIGGMAFLPANDAAYNQMPYEEIDGETYAQMVAAMPEIDFSLLHAYEKSDMTTAAQELACSAGACDV